MVTEIKFSQKFHSYTVTPTTNPSPIALVLKFYNLMVFYNALSIIFFRVVILKNYLSGFSLQPKTTSIHIANLHLSLLIHGCLHV